MNTRSLLPLFGLMSFLLGEIDMTDCSAVVLCEAKGFRNILVSSSEKSRHSAFAELRGEIELESLDGISLTEIIGAFP